MGKILLSCIITALFCFKTQAQISDFDARQLYQLAEDDYNNSYYYFAAQRLQTLRNKMGSWTPKVLYLYLKSAHKNYTAANQSDFFKKNHSTFLEFSNRTDTFFNIIKTINYPEDKYKEIQVVQAYFREQLKTYAYQKDRTPQDAVDFLNACAKKFPNQGINDMETKAKRSQFYYDIKFSLNNTILSIRNNCRMYGPLGSGPFWSAQKEVTFIDLSKITTLVYHSADMDDYASAYLEGPTTFEDGKKVFTGIVTATEKGCCSLKQSEKVFNDTNIPPLQMAFQNWDHKEFLDILCNFNKSSAEYKDGNYNERIKEAIQFLIDYFPKQKEEEKPQEPKSKF